MSEADDVLGHNVPSIDSLSVITRRHYKLSKGRAVGEIILESHLYSDETFAEGPFGEFTGYYGRPSGATPYMRVQRLRYRNNRTLTCALMADGPPNDCGLFWAAARGPL